MPDLIATISSRLATYRPPSEDLRASGAGIARRLYREGWTSLDQLRRMLRLLAYDDIEIAQQEYIASLEFDYDWRTDVLATLRDAFRKGAIRPDEFLAELDTLGMARGRALQHLQREQIKKARGVATEEPPVKTLTPAQVLRAHAAGILDEDQATFRLKDAGYSLQDITILLALALQEPETPVRRLSPQENLQALARGFITQAEYLRRMAALAYLPEDALLLARLHQAPPTEPQLRELSPAQLIKAFQVGILPEDLLRRRLTDLDYRPQDADLLILVAATRASPTLSPSL